MESKFIQFVNENKWFVVFYLVWLFMQLILYFVSDGEPYYYQDEGFWPFNGEMDIDAYDFLELFFHGCQIAQNNPNDIVP